MAEEIEPLRKWYIQQYTLNTLREKGIIDGPIYKAAYEFLEAEYQVTDVDYKARQAKKALPAKTRYEARGGGFMHVGKGAITLEETGLRIWNRHGNLHWRYSDIVEVNYQPPSGWAGPGYIQILRAGQMATKDYEVALKQPNVVVYARSQKAEFLELKRIIQQRMGL